jgi:iron(III) transport system substrate-binding protein
MRGIVGAASALIGVLAWLSCARAQPAAGGSLPERFAGLYAAAKKDGEVVFLSNGRQDAAEKISAFWKKNFPEVRLLLTPAGGPAIIARVEAERAAGQQPEDVTQISLLNVAVAWKQKGFYQPYRTATMAHYLPDRADADGAFYSAHLLLLPAAYGTKAFPDKSALPAGLKDFLDPRWKGKIVFPDPATAGNAEIFLMTLLAKGLIDWPYLERLAAQDVLFVRGDPDVVRMLASGERAVAPLLTALNVAAAKEKQQPVDSYILAEGVIIAQNALGIMSGAHHPNAAKLLMEALLSPEGQAVMAEGGAFLPADASVAIPGAPPIAGLKIITPPAPSPADEAQTAAFMTRFRQVFGRR